MGRKPFVELNVLQLVRSGHAVIIVVFGLALSCSLGCGLNGTPSASGEPEVDAATADQPDQIVDETAALQSPVELSMERVPAAAGVGKKGRALDKFDSGVQRMIAQPAKSLFATEEKMVFAVQIPQALQLFQATEGRMPRSHEEFMTRIIQANNIRLPELPEGQEYEFDSDSGELMVARPTN